MNTLFDKIWDSHVVQIVPDGPQQLYIDRLYCHEVTSPQAFDGLRQRGLNPFRQQNIYCMPDSRSRKPETGGHTCAQRNRIRTQPFRHDAPQKRHHTRRRPRTRPHTSRNDHRMRRLAHLNPRSARRSCLRNRYK